MPLRVGLVGAGEVAGRHADAVPRVAGLALAAVTDVDADRAYRLAGRTGAAAVPDYDALLAEVDLVVLTVPHALHAPYAVRAVDAGRHVLVEKPMATTVADCDAMTAAAERAGVLLWVGQQQRQFAQVRAAREALAGLGEPLLYAERRSADYPRDGSRPAWFFDPDAAGGGIAMMAGVHSVDRACWLLGAGPVAVAGTVARPDGWRVESDAACLLYLDGGPPVHLALHADEHFYHETTVVCANGRLTIDPAGATVVPAGGPPRRLLDVDPDGAYGDSFARQYGALLDTLRDGVPPAVTPAEGRAAVATVCALYASAAAGGAPVAVA
jgi:predicted dehydrogenase